MLRQDPDTILVGEIRDKETAEIAVQASLTGHLVFSTLHTNDAPSAIARLLDLGLEPFLVTATLEGIVAQRLVRKICLNCKTEYTPSEEQLMELELRPEDVAGKMFYYGKGCEDCNNTGYRGRQGMYEIMMLDDEMRDLIIKHASTQVLRIEAKKRGMRTLRQSGLMAIYDGVTTIEEVVRETIMEERLSVVVLRLTQALFCSLVLGMRCMPIPRCVGWQTLSRVGDMAGWPPGTFF